MSEEVELAVVYLGAGHAATGFTRHMIAGDPMPHPAMLRIVQYDKDANSYFLLYCDPDGASYTDTWHQTIADAMKQAELEFNVGASEWIRAKT